MCLTRLTLPVLIFILSISTAVLAQSKRRPDDIETVSFCDLINNAERYDKKVVRVRAIYAVGLETSRVYIPGCDKATWAEVDSGVKKASDSKALKNFRRLTKGRTVRSKGVVTYPMPRRVEILAVGRFDGVKPTYHVGPMTLRPGFGHMDAFDYQFTILKLEEANPVGKGVPWE
jgi:hypothetical protein